MRQFGRIHSIVILSRGFCGEGSVDSLAAPMLPADSRSFSPQKRGLQDANAMESFQD
jgi:hypothetical protein